MRVFQGKNNKMLAVTAHSTQPRKCLCVCVCVFKGYFPPLFIFPNFFFLPMLLNFTLAVRLFSKESLLGKSMTCRCRCEQQFTTSLG